MPYVPGTVGGVGGGLELGAKRSKKCFSTQPNIYAVLLKCRQQRGKNKMIISIS